MWHCRYFWLRKIAISYAYPKYYGNFTEVTQELKNKTTRTLSRFNFPEIILHKLYKYCPLGQWFSNFTVHTKQLCILWEWFPVALGWGRRVYTSNKLQGMWTLLSWNILLKSSTLDHIRGTLGVYQWYCGFGPRPPQYSEYCNNMSRMNLLVSYV